MSAAAEAIVRAWRNGDAPPYVCAHCGASAVTVDDRSARPHVEWYAVVCAACGKEDIVQMSLGSRPPQPGND